MNPQKNRISVFLMWVALLGAYLIFFPYPNIFPRAHLPADVEDALKNADTFTLFSIDPAPDYEHKFTNTFQDHVILGRLDVKSLDRRQELINALNSGIGAEG